MVQKIGRKGVDAKLVRLQRDGSRAGSPSCGARCGAPSPLFPPIFYPPSLFLTLTPISLSLFVQIFISSLLPIFLFFPFFSFFFQYLNAPPEGPAGPPEARGPRHVPFVSLWGSGTAVPGIVIVIRRSTFFCLLLRERLQKHACTQNPKSLKSKQGRIYDSISRVWVDMDSYERQLTCQFALSDRPTE